ncbi:ATPase domain-containing protein [Anaeromyxobacter sp. Fw109-5]|uniref:ATPase domain-containing protein n=1 Tax=Anaeromyxobacter sp. (strain Fw109-5) TaxID=404589 RepID=UPI0000ED8AA3|nr:ATPase domain-containing protein [Anaeromyxobacter sp. Fw109-5]ABS27424.1 Non-specific serine/threonine protein kinase [Anaeromyxobacter sp. Fw109-5]
MENERVQTGVRGLDPILNGGLIRNSLYLLKGAPGTGKTTIGLQFLLEGARRGEKCLYLGLSETRGQVDALASSFGWSTDGVEVHDMRRRGEAEQQRGAYTVFSPHEVELEEISKEILAQVDRVQPSRLVLDSLSEIRLLADDSFRYRRALLRLGDQIAGRNCTGLLIDVDTEPGQGVVAETLVSGVLELEQLSPDYGGDRRRLRVRKLRASQSVGGYHDMEIGAGGVHVFPRLVASQHRTMHSSSEVLSGIAELDRLLGGGLDRGTSTVLVGPAGTGKSTIAAQFVARAASRGEKGAILCFDESPTNLLIRTTGLGIPLRSHVEAGTVEVRAVDPAEMSPGQLSDSVRQLVEEDHRIVVLDSLNGYINAMPGERFLAAHLHELLAYLSEKGVATLLTLAQHGFVASSESPFNISYIADTVLLFRYFEVAGEVRQALSVVKKRTGGHERTIRELRFEPSGVVVGEPLLKFQGIFSGIPQILDPDALRAKRGSSER